MTRQLSAALRHHTASSWRGEALQAFPPDELSEGRLNLSGSVCGGGWGGDVLAPATSLPFLLHPTVGWLTLYSVLTWF